MEGCEGGQEGGKQKPAAGLRAWPVRSAAAFWGTGHASHSVDCRETEGSPKQRPANYRPTECDGQ